MCVHGGMDRATAFARLRRRLHEAVPGVTTVAYDRRGYASSVDLAIDPAFVRQIDDLAAVVNETRAVTGASSGAASAPLVIVGHSLGGTIALGYAARGPDHLVGVVVGEPPMSWMPWWPSGAGASTLAVHRAHGPQAAAEAFMRRIVGERVWERLPEATKQARRAEGAALVNDLASLRVGGAPFDLGSIDAPVVVLRGSRSLSHAKRGSEYAAASLRSARLVVLQGAAHGLHTERPDDLALAVADLHLANGAAGPSGG